jgi:dimethylamine/trimethylamine dehydrogenase
MTSRFAAEGYQEEFVRFVKKVTTKPVVGVGRFTSPDTMVSQIRRGVLDMIGAARPSIADPFLPKKIENGEVDDIRECIGCNVCVTGDYTMTPIRCTQNPTMGEEWRKGWHPEAVPRRTGSDSFLVVGAGPCGLECARLLGRRGYSVYLAEAGEQLGGRVTRESRLPGLAAWARVRDYRLNQLNKMQNVQMLRASRVTAGEVLELGVTRVVLATGSHWRRDGVGRANHHAIRGFDAAQRVFTPDEVMDGVRVSGPVVVFDDDHYYLGAVLAEKLRSDGSRRLVGHTRRSSFGLDRQHPGTACHSKAIAGTRRRGAFEPQCRRIGWLRTGARVHVHGTPNHRACGVGRCRDLASAER